MLPKLTQTMDCPTRWNTLCSWAVSGTHTMLDIIANNCQGSWTSAYTDKDHTAYELYTAGSSGFLKVLPVFLDHLLRPTLTQPQYDTKVHHIKGEGKDSGIVYSEVQAVEFGMDFFVGAKEEEAVQSSGKRLLCDGRRAMANATYASRARAAKSKKRQAVLRKAARARAGNIAKSQRAERCVICRKGISPMTRTTMGCHHPLHQRCLYNFVRANLDCPDGGGGDRPEQTCGENVIYTGVIKLHSSEFLTINKEISTIFRHFYAVLIQQLTAFTLGISSCSIP
ncbi:hypothetical protein niasHT_014349 [Heterodera trifolii]|uniref:RING-type domain-containing protein n=1 Tax=Heterodera trifolii TaxID=157864 RepID=A0ABD2LH44_9BILA